MRNVYVFVLTHTGWQQHHTAIKEFFKSYDQRRGWSLGRAFGHRTSEVYGDLSANLHIVFNVHDENMAALFRLTFSEIVKRSVVLPDYKS